MKFSNTLLLALLFNCAIFSQNEIRLGLGTGLNYSSIRNNSLGNPNSDFGYLFSLDFEYYLTENLSFKSGFIFEKKATNLEVGVPKYKDTYNYILIPLLLKYDFGKSNDFFVNGGAFFGHLLSRYFGDKEISEINNKRFDSGISLGFGKTIKLNKKNIISFEIRNNLGLISIHNNEITRRFNEEDIYPKTNSVNLIMNWIFKL